MSRPQNEIGEHAAQAAKLLKSLSHPARLGLLCCLVEGEMAVTDIQENIKDLGLSQSALSQHLGKLRAEGIVTYRRDHRRLLYSIANEDVKKIIETLHGIYCQN